MPIEPNPQPFAAWPHSANVAMPDGSGMSVQVSLQSDGTAAPGAMDATLQDLVDYLQAWPGKAPGTNVTGQKYDTLIYTISPTDPEAPPEPPEEDPDPNDLQVQGDEAPSTVV